MSHQRISWSLLAMAVTAIFFEYDHGFWGCMILSKLYWDSAVEREGVE